MSPADFPSFLYTPNSQLRLQTKVQKQAFSAHPITMGSSEALLPPSLQEETRNYYLLSNFQLHCILLKGLINSQLIINSHRQLSYTLVSRLFKFIYAIKNHP